MLLLWSDLCEWLSLLFQDVMVVQRILGLRPYQSYFFDTGQGRQSTEKNRKCSLYIKVPGNSVHPMDLSFASTQDLQNMLLCGARISLGSDCHHISQLVPLMAVIEIKSGLVSVSKQLFSTCSAFTSVTLKARQVSPRFANGHSALLQAGALHTRLQNALVIAPRYTHQSLPEVHFFFWQNAFVIVPRADTLLKLRQLIRGWETEAQRKQW